MSFVSSLKINRKTFGKDILAGLTAAIAGIPDGMASATLAGVNPVYGLYNLMLGTPIAAGPSIEQGCNAVVVAGPLPDNRIRQPGPEMDVRVEEAGQNEHAFRVDCRQICGQRFV